MIRIWLLLLPIVIYQRISNTIYSRTRIWEAPTELVIRKPDEFSTFHQIGGRWCGQIKIDQKVSTNSVRMVRIYLFPIIKWYCLIVIKEYRIYRKKDHLKTDSLSLTKIPWWLMCFRTQFSLYCLDLFNETARFWWPVSRRWHTRVSARFIAAKRCSSHIITRLL